jgi:hypothetical protein
VRNFYFVVAVLVSSAICSRANTFSVDQGTVTAGGSCAAGVQNCPVNVSYAFTGPGLSTSGTYSGNGVDFAHLFGNTYVFQMQFVANGPLNGGDFGQGLSVNGALVLSSAFFTLAAANTFANGTSITVNLPITFFGSLAVCATSCASGQLASYGFNGNTGRVGTGQLQLTSNGSSWLFTSGTFTLVPTPEPGTILLFGTGALGLIRNLVRRTN